MEEIKYELHAASANDANLKKLLQATKKWLNSNDILGITVTDIYKDLFVAKLLVGVIEKYTKERIVNLSSMPGCTWRDYQFIMGKIVSYTENNLFSAPDRWSLKGILDKDFSSLLCFILDLSAFFNNPISPPQSIVMVVTAITTVNGTETRKNHKYQITLTPSMEALNNKHAGMSLEELHIADVYESLVDTPEKFQEVCELLVLFVNNNLQLLGLSISQMKDLSDGSLTIILIGILGNFFVPMCNYTLKVSTEEDVVKNWELVMKLLKRVNVDTSKINYDLLHSPDNLAEISKVIFLIQQIGGAE